MKRTILFILFLTCVRFNAEADEVTKTGTTAAPFLSIGVGARAIGMGGAFTAVANDVTAMYWNPSGIARLKQSEILFCHTRWLADVSLNYSGIAVPFENFGTLGVQALFLTMDDMERTTLMQPDGTGETFEAGSYAFGLSYARNLTERFSIGFSVKYIYEMIYHCASRGVAFDVGTLFTTQLNGLTIGMSISNYGTKMKMSGRDLLVQHDINPLVSGNNPNINADLQTDAFDLPMLFRVGVAMDMLKGRGNSNLILSVDALYPNDDRESLNIGCEYVLYKMFAFRAGYKSLFLKDSEQGLCLGAGLMYTLAKRTSLEIDYTYQRFGVLKDVQKCTIGIKL